MLRNAETKGLGGLEVDDAVELPRLLDWKVGEAHARGFEVALRVEGVEIVVDQHGGYYLSCVLVHPCRGIL